MKRPARAEAGTHAARGGAWVVCCLGWVMAAVLAGCGGKQTPPTSAYPAYEQKAPAEQAEQAGAERGRASGAPSEMSTGAESVPPEDKEFPPPLSSPGPVPAAPAARPRYATPPPPMSPSGQSLPGADRASALIDDFLVAEAALLASGASCLDACRALRSMQRAAAGLCEMASSQAEHRRCEAAQDRYRAARERVRGACGQCQGGPSLEPDAPIQDDR